MGLFFLLNLKHGPVFRDDIKAESLVDALADSLDAGLELERLVRHDLGRGLVVGDHAKGLLFSLVVAVVLVPRGSDRLLLHEKEVACAGEQLVQGSGIDGFLQGNKRRRKNVEKDELNGVLKYQSH